MNIFSKFTKQAFVFRRWSRKSYAVFASLKKNIKIGVLSVSITTSLHSTDLNFGVKKLLLQIELLKFKVASFCGVLVGKVLNYKFLSVGEFSFANNYFK
ncbi:MAG: hypothetical protein IPO21_20175 [Bacteroidales bacterium]|nr:hypothetical protein [Bacteroidales bacterium]